MTKFSFLGELFLSVFKQVMSLTIMCPYQNNFFSFVVKHQTKKCLTLSPTERNVLGLVQSGLCVSLVILRLQRFVEGGEQPVMLQPKGSGQIRD